jgi:hypothetical protein
VVCLLLPALATAAENAVVFWEWDQPAPSFQGGIDLEVQGSGRTTVQALVPLEVGTCQALATQTSLPWTPQTRCAITCLPQGPITATAWGTPRTTPSNQARATIPRPCDPPRPAAPGTWGNIWVVWEHDRASRGGLAGYELELVSQQSGRLARQTVPLVPVADATCQEVVQTREPGRWHPDTLCARACLPQGAVTGRAFARYQALTIGRKGPSNEADTTATERCGEGETSPAPAAMPAPPPVSVIAGATAIATTTGVVTASENGPSLPALLNRQCVDWKIAGPCLCGFPPHPCTQVQYWRPRWLVEVVKRPGSSAIPVLGTVLSAALQAVGMPSMGGGGQGNASGAGHTNLAFSEVHVYSFPDLLGGPCTACAPTNALPVLHYASELDAPVWRTTVAPPLPFAALIPVGVWGTLFPRTGFVIHSSPPIAAALQAVRALNIAFAPATPVPSPEAHVVVTPSGGFSTCMQMASPRPTPCMTIGTPPPMWEMGSVSHTGSYIFLFWERQHCCVEAAMATCGITLPVIGGHGANMCPLP